MSMLAAPTTTSAHEKPQWLMPAVRLLGAFWTVRPETHARMNSAGSQCKYVRRRSTLSDQHLHDHLVGRETYAAPLISANGTTCIGALDIDHGGEQALAAVLEAAACCGLVAWAITSQNVEHDGGWCWLRYAADVDPARIRAQLEQVARLAQVQAEVFPTRQDARLPFGIHRWSGRRGILLLQDGRRFDLDTAQLAAGIEAVAVLSLNLAPLPIDKPSVAVGASRLLPELVGKGDVIGQFCASTDLASLLSQYPGYRAASHASANVTFHCGCPHHKGGDRHPSLAIKSGRDGRQVLVGYSPNCIWHNHDGRNDAFNVYCVLEGLSFRDAVRRLSSRPLRQPSASYPPHPADRDHEVTGPDTSMLAARSKDAARKRQQRRDDALTVRQSVQARLEADTTLSARGRRVISALLDLAGERDWCRPSVARLMALTSVSERTVQYGLRDLELAGYIASSASSGGTSYRHFVAPVGVSSSLDQPALAESARLAPVEPSASEVADGLPALCQLAPVEPSTSEGDQVFLAPRPLAPVEPSGRVEIAPKCIHELIHDSTLRACEGGATTSAASLTELPLPGEPVAAQPDRPAQPRKAKKKKPRQAEFGNPAPPARRPAEGLPRSEWTAAAVTALEAELARKRSMLQYVKRAQVRWALNRDIATITGLIDARRAVGIAVMEYASSPAPTLNEPRVVALNGAVIVEGGAVFMPTGGPDLQMLQALLAEAVAQAPPSQAPMLHPQPSAPSLATLPAGWTLERCDYKGNLSRYGVYWMAVGPAGERTEPTAHRGSAEADARRQSSVVLLSHQQEFRQTASSYH